MEQPRTRASADSSPHDAPFKSKLPDAAPRFLAHVIEHALTHGRRSPDDFIRHFPPKVIMEGLKDEPQLRANILVIATGVRMKVALKKPASSSGADLQIALDEHETDAETVVGLFDPDDRVRFLDNRALWAFVTEGDVWKTEAKKDPAAHAHAAAHVSYIIERALEDKLLTHRDVVRGISVNAMASYLPRSELPKILEAALELGNAKKPFVEKNLLDAVPVATLAQYVPLPAIWQQVVLPFIAEPHGFVPRQEVPAARPAARSEGERAPSPEVAAAPAAAAPIAAAAPAREAAPPARPAPVAAAPLPQAPAPPAQAQPVAPAMRTTEPELEAGLDLEVDELLGSLADEPEPPVQSAARKPFRVPTPGRTDSVPPRA